MIDLEGVGDVADVARVQARKRGGGDGAHRRRADGSASPRSTRIVADRAAAPRRGRPRQERVAYLAKNSRGVLFICVFGAAKAGAALAPINFRLAAPEIG